MTLAIDFGLLSLAASMYAASEVWRRVSIVPHAKALAGVGRRASVGISRRGVSDAAKERLAGIAACLTLRHSTRLAAALFAVASPILMLLVADRWIGLGVWKHLSDLQSRLLIAAMTIGMLVIRYARR